jgi:hypothetical protein
MHFKVMLERSETVLVHVSLLALCVTTIINCLSTWVNFAASLMHFPIPHKYFEAILILNLASATNSSCQILIRIYFYICSFLYYCFWSMNFPCIKTMVFSIFLKVVATTIFILFFFNFSLELYHMLEYFFAATCSLV